jgi:hypothetical protein
MAKLNNKKWKKSLFYEEKSLVGLTLGPIKINKNRVKVGTGPNLCSLRLSIFGLSTVHALKKPKI